MTTDFEVANITLRDVLGSAIDGVFVFDRDRRCVLFSDACERITGYDSAEVVGGECRCHDVTDCRDEVGRPLAGVLCPSRQLFSEEIPSVRQRMTMRHKSGRAVYVETIFSPIRNDGGRVSHVLGIMRDVTELHDRQAHLDEAARRIEGSSDGPSRGDACHSADRPHRETGELITLDQKLAETERCEILRALDTTHGQRTLAARILGISRSRLYRRMAALGIGSERPGPRTDG